MENAENAGTSASRSSPISLIEDDDGHGEFRYMFCVRFSIDGPALDMFYDACRGMSWSEVRSRKAASRLTDKPDVEIDRILSGAASRFFAMDMRVRANLNSMEGPCLVSSDEPLSPDDLEGILRHHAVRHTLREFLKSCRM